MSTFEFSVDWQAEIRKITQRQSLNHVHFLVLLVRHALTHQPNQIQIRGQTKELVIEQDGDPLSSEESALLHILIGKDTQSFDRKQQALSTLEDRYGIALLSLMLQHPRVILNSAGLSLQVEHGSLTVLRDQVNRKGYQLILSRTGGRVREEKKELSFYAEFAKTPIFFNGQLVTGGNKNEGSLVSMTFESRYGQGQVSIPMEGELSTHLFLKSGVRFGIRRFLAPGGWIYQGIWDSALVHFEPEYRDSIDYGEQALVEQIPILYRNGAGHFQQMSETQKARFKTLLLQIESEDWLSSFGRLPLFADGSGSFKVSLEDLRTWAKLHGTIPYLKPSRYKKPTHVPRLDHGDLLFIRERFGLKAETIPLKRKSTHKQEATTEMPSHIQPIQPRGKVAVLIEHLNQGRPWTVYYPCKGPGAIWLGRDGRRHVALAVDSPLVVESADRLAANGKLSYREYYKLQMSDPRH